MKRISIDCDNDGTHSPLIKNNQLERKDIDSPLIKEDNEQPSLQIDQEKMLSKLKRKSLVPQIINKPSESIPYTSSTRFIGQSSRHLDGYTRNESKKSSIIFSLGNGKRMVNPSGSISKTRSFLKELKRLNPLDDTTPKETQLMKEYIVQGDIPLRQKITLIDHVDLCHTAYQIQKS